MSEQFYFLSIHWLWLLPLFWAYWLWWFAKHSLGHSESMADVDVNAQSHYYHPLAMKLIAKQQYHVAKPLVFIKSYRFWLQGGVISLLIISLAQPVLIGERLPDAPPEHDIIFLVDTSVSMQLKDYQWQGEMISRMELLHYLLDEFASKMKGERIAVIVFAESAYILVPLSHDQGLIRGMLSRVTTRLAGRYSAVGDALLMALFITKEEERIHPNRHQTVIMFTDAHDAMGEVSTTAGAELLAEKNIPVYTIAIGSSDRDKDVKGGLYQSVNLTLLTDIAKRTGGENYQVNDGLAMDKALQSILKQRENTAIPKPQYEQELLYWYPLLLGVFLMLLWQFWIGVVNI
ncbi:MAG: VWA domain-containing protein [Thiotrichaceae bacterium]|nr:VWA domain-containing protein [Thiotrichaceae bacterium]